MKLPRVHRMTKGGTLYKWHRVTRAPLPTDIPEDHPDFIAAWNAEEAKKAPDRSRATKGSIAAAWEGLKATAAFRGYSSAYRAMVVRHGDAIATLYGAGPMADLRDYHIRKDLEKLDAHPAIARLKTWRLICAHARNEIRDALKTLGLTQRQAAPLLGYGDQSRISDLVCGREKPGAAVVLLIRAYLAGYRPSNWPTA